ncbi:MAG TPA: Gfo/Idh/MocA family oxidoreductase [Prolixibacteraceae bacterium]|nr:Gfo/Idh/MocA family oxidoreductase [Prolixibacteraceae bacterium]
MASNRRDFLKHSLIGAGILGSGLTSLVVLPEAASAKTKKKVVGAQQFNMCGFVAPKLDVVRIGIIGLGNRGPGAVDRLSYIQGVEIKALGDLYEDRVEKAQNILTKKGLPKAVGYSGSRDAWKQMCERDDIDLIYTCTPWAMHTPIAVYAMEHGKHAATEVPAAITLEECWQLVETSEKTRKHCMMLENCCYDFFELMTLNMVRQGYFGEVIHGEGAYIHNLLSSNFDKEGYAEMWRLKENFKNGNLYPTHGLGPICQIMNINRGDQMDYLVAMQSNDFMMAETAKRLAAQDGFYNEFAGKTYRGNMNNTVIRTFKGKTILVQHDVTSPRPYSRLHIVAGTKAYAQKYPTPARVAVEDAWLNPEEMKKLEDQYSPEIVRKVGEMAKEIGGHGGMDFMMDWRLIDCLRNGLPLDQDVYDAALWSSISPLSQQSIANRSASVDIPDFTRGAWKNNQPVELTLKGGGTTGVNKKK